MYRTERETLINASAEDVWAVLTDFSEYPQWNPFVRRAEGTFALGETFKLEVQLGDAIWNVKQKIVELDPGRSYAWTSRSWYVLLATWGLRRFTIEPLGPDRCRFHDREDTHGPLSFIVKAKFGQALVDGLAGAGDALKAEAEKRRAA